MANKVIIGILALLVILVGGSGYYSYTLNQRIDLLGERLTTFETEQTGRVEAVRDELGTLRTETMSGISSLKDQIEVVQGQVDTLDEDLGKAEARVSSLEEEIGGFGSRIENLDERISSAEADISRSLIDVNEVYEKVSQATVRITNGQSTVGSGLILDTERHVVTAYHVIDGLSQIDVILHDGRVFKATVVGSCAVSDVAVLSLGSNPSIEPPPLADSAMVLIGEPVIAIGSPLDLPDTLTAGIISQVNRYVEIEYDSQGRWVPNLLQFDAAVNPGNSGCPLANSDGEIIGIVIARVSPAEGDGIYYAVASNKVRRVAESIIASGSFDYPWIGIGISDLTPKLVQEKSLETANGVLVGEVFSGGPAKAAGVNTGDVILSIDGALVRDSADLTSYLGEFRSPGDMSVIEITRDGAKIELSLRIGMREP
jgi:S1-C subfamily serine protease